MKKKGISQHSQLDVICSQSAYKITNAWIKLDPWRAWPLLDLGIINILNQRILFPTADRDNCICNTLFVTNKPSVIRDYTNHEIIDILNTLPLLSIVIILAFSCSMMRDFYICRILLTHHFFTKIHVIKYISCPKFAEFICNYV